MGRAAAKEKMSRVMEEHFKVLWPERVQHSPRRRWVISASICLSTLPLAYHVPPVAMLHTDIRLRVPFLLAAVDFSG